MVRHLRVYAVRHTAGHTLFGIPVSKVFPLLLHHILLFLAHGAAHKVASAHGIAAQLPHNLHHLLLIHDAAVGGR